MEQYELAPSAEPPQSLRHAQRSTMPPDEAAEPHHDPALHKRTLRKLDLLLLPFLALLFLFNSLDKSNVCCMPFPPVLSYD